MASNDTADAQSVAVIDIGSNTVLLLVHTRDGPTLEDSRITRLGQGVFQTGELNAAATRRTREAIGDFAKRARAAGAQTVVGVGTEALRTAPSGRDFLAHLCEDGVLDRALLLSGQEEAEFAIEATRRSREGGPPVAVIDVGGGSTELAWTLGDGGIRGFSAPMGSVRYTEAFLPEHPVPADDMEALRERIRARAAGYPRLSPETEVYALAGTATTLAALDLALEPYDPARVENYRLRRERLRHWISRLAAMAVDERKELPGLEPQRADIIVAGLVILDGVLERIGAGEFLVSGRGVRHGVALKLLDAAPGV